MKAKSFEIEAFTISETAKKLGYKSTRTIYTLLNKDILEDYVYLTQSGRVYLILEQPNLLTLTKKLEEILNSEVRIISIFSSSKWFIYLFKYFHLN